MFQRVKPLLLITLSLILAGMACRLGGRSRVELGEKIQSDYGGFILQTIPDYEIEEFFGMVYMIAADADPDFGPFIMAAGELHDEDITPQQLLDQMQGETEDIEFGAAKQNRVDGIDGLLVEFSGEEAGRTVKGKVFVATPQPQQEFYIVGMAPEDQWKDFEPYFDAVLASVSFIDAQPFDWDFDDWDDDWDDDWEDFDDGDDVGLGDLVQSDEGGFMLQAIPGYETEEFFGMVIMTAPGADPDVGPLVMAVGDMMVAEFGAQEILDNMKMDAEGYEFSPEMPFIVDGVEGLLANFSGTEAGQAVQGKIYAAAPRPLQEFYILAVAPQGDWLEIEPLFDAVLDTIIFMDAQPFDWGFDDWDDDELVEVVQEIRQWAVAAEASSEYSLDDYSAMQATGEPAVSACEENPRAWASLSPDTEEYLILYYETPVNPTELVIYQSHNPSQIVEINFIDTTGETWLAWYGDPHESEFCPDVWTHTFALDEVFYTDTVVLWVDQSILGLGWVEIDAVELVGYTMGVSAEPIQDEPDQPAPPPVGDIPTNFTGLMAGPVYQGWISIVLGETMEEDLDRIMTIEGRESTDSWKPRESHKQTYLYQMPWDGMTGFISVTVDGWVYKINVSNNTHPDDFALATVNRDTYEELTAIYDRDKAIPYAVMANMLESPGFLRETYIGNDDGIIRSIYNWYNANGDRITGIFVDGVLTGMLGLNYIEAE